MSDFKPDVYIDQLALEKLKAYYKYANKGEISGLGVCVIEEGQPYVKDVMLFKQESSGSETELDADTLAKWDYELRKAGGDPTLYRLWWHKHPIKGWSSVDENNIRLMNNGEWLLSIVQQSDHTLLARLDLYAPFRITLDELDVIELREYDAEMDEAIKQEVAEKVKFKTYTVTTYQGRVPSQWSGGVYHPDGQGEKKDTTARQIALPNGEIVVPSTSERDRIFEEMADRDWESYYGWEVRDPDRPYRLLGG